MRLIAAVLAVALVGCSSDHQSSYAQPQSLLVETSANGDDALDDTASIAADLEALDPRQTLKLEAGTYYLNSATLAASPLFIKDDHVTIQGESKQATRIVITGTTAIPWIFAAVGKSDIAFRDLTMVGNSVSTSYGNGGAITFSNSLGPASALSVTDCHFENFAGDFWIHVENVSGLTPIDGVNVSWCTFATLPGNSRLPQLVTGPQGMVGIIAHNSSPTGGINNVRVDNNAVACTHAKGLLALFGNCDGISVCNNAITGAGTGPEFADDSACYAIMCYNNFKPPRNGLIASNRIVAVRDDGMYLQGCEDFTITGNHVSGQTSSVSGTLPKAGIAMNGMRRSVAVDNTVLDCHNGLYVQGFHDNDPTSNLTVSDNTVLGARSCGIRIESASLPWHGLLMSGNHVRSLGHGIFMAPTAAIKNVTIIGNHVEATSWCVRVISSDGLYQLDDLAIASNHFSAIGTGLVNHVCVRLFSTSHVAITNNVMSGTVFQSIDVFGTPATVSGNLLQ